MPLDVQVVVNRYQGDKRVSSLPYTLAVNANDRTISSIRMGARVPVPRGATAPAGLPPVNYQSIGTNIDCFARTMDDGRFQVNLVIEDSSIYENVPGAVQPSTDERRPCSGPSSPPIPWCCATARLVSSPPPPTA